MPNSIRGLHFLLLAYNDLTFPSLPLALGTPAPSKHCQTFSPSRLRYISSIPTTHEVDFPIPNTFVKLRFHTGMLVDAIVLQDTCNTVPRSWRPN